MAADKVVNSESKRIPKRKSVLILVPRLNSPGGVANYYSILESELLDEIRYIYRGKKSGQNLLLRLLADYRYFIKSQKEIDDVGLVMINTSLGIGGFLRDGVYSILTKKKIRKIIFFRGWSPGFEKKIDRSKLFRFLFRMLFLNADHIIVLSNAFKEKIIKWGYTGKVDVETTIFDERLLNGKNAEALHNQRKSISPSHIFYIGYMSKDKGVWEIVKSSSELIKNGKNNVQFTMAGDGEELDGLKNFAMQDSLPIQFPGYVYSEQKTELFQKAHIFVFASYHEGMPNSVLEAIAFGLPVITTRVGGLRDFFVDGKMGLFLDSTEPGHIAEKISSLLERPDLMERMSHYNFQYAKENFYSDKVSYRLMRIIDRTLAN